MTTPKTEFQTYRYALKEKVRKQLFLKKRKNARINKVLFPYARVMSDPRG